MASISLDLEHDSHRGIFETDARTIDFRLSGNGELVLIEIGNREVAVSADAFFALLPALERLQCSR